MRIVLVAVLAASAALAGCTTIPAVGSAVKLDPETANQCSAHCGSLGMDLGAVVIIRNSTGCVCAPRGKGSANASGASGVAGGAAVQIIDDEQAAQERHRS